jgi:hypothetical protein
MQITLAIGDKSMLSFRAHMTHEKYTETYQHWCPQSEKYAGGDQLLSAVRSGWVIDENTVYAEQDWKSGSRLVTIYHFVLTRGNKTMVMPVINNPFIERFITEKLITLVYDSDVVLVSAS